MTIKQRQFLPFLDKLSIICQVKNSEKKSDVATAYNIPISMFSTILKNKAAICQKSRNWLNAVGKQLREPAFDKVEKALYAWFLEICAQNLPVSGPINIKEWKWF